MAKRQKKTTRLEYEELLKFAKSNKILHGKPKPLEAVTIKNLWQTFADRMTVLAIGPRKSADQWKKIFIEWKVNVKRKSRLIHEESTGTGGGPKISKPLSDLEERLLNLISAVHLGDSRLPDRLGNAEAVHKAEDGIVKEEPPLIDSANCLNPFEIIIADFTENGSEVNMPPPDQSSEDVKPIQPIVEKPLSKTSQGDKSRPGRYTNEILLDACNSFKNANDTNFKSSEVLAEAINKFTEVFKIKAEADMLRAKAEMAKAKCLHFQTFGNLDDFSF